MDHMDVQVIYEPPPRETHCWACGYRLNGPRENACSQVCADSLNAEVRRERERWTRMGV